jgi:hypothetical protein
MPPASSAAIRPAGSNTGRSIAHGSSSAQSASARSGSGASGQGGVVSIRWRSTRSARSGRRAGKKTSSPANRSPGSHVPARRPAEAGV